MENQASNERDECREFRQSVELGKAFETAGHEHLSVCEACQVWQEQTRSILQMTADIPQFDVSEQLTQRILQESSMLTTGPSTNWQLIGITLAAVLGMAVILLDASESIGGWWAWAVSFAAMIGFQCLFRQPQDPMIES